MPMQGRFTGGLTNYHFGFNGKENDDEVKGYGNEVYYENRVYDVRSGKFLSIDPLQKKYPWYSPYQFTGNSPIAHVDPDGKERHYYTLTYTDGQPKLQFSKTEVDHFTVFGRQKYDEVTYSISFGKKNFN